MTEVAEFLSRLAPFTGLTEAELQGISDSVEMRSFVTGQDALVEDGPPATHFYVVASGAMELMHEDEIIDVLEPGEGFGHPSLLTGLAPAFTVRAHQDSICYLIPREVAETLLGRPAGASFVAATLRKRLIRAGHTVHALPEVRTMRVASLVHRPALFCDPDDAIRDVAQSMHDQAAPAVLVKLRDGLGIVTDADFREKVVAQGMPSDGPVAAIATSPVVTINESRLAVEAAIEMLHANVRHLPVVGAHGDVVGILSAADLMNLENLSPFGLRRSIANAPNEEALFEAASHLPRVFVALLDAGLQAADIGRVLALQSDSVVQRLIDFTIDRNGPAPVPWAWLALGSVARRELTLASDQDNALAYAHSDDPERVDTYFERFAIDVNAGLDRCGFGADAADVLARNSAWRMSDAEWLKVFRECFQSPDRAHLVRAAVSFDFRQVAGGLEIVPLLTGVLREAPMHAGFLDRLARTATDWRPPLAFRRRLKDKLDIKKGAVVPIANLARFHALSNGVTISGTLARLIAVEELGALDSNTAQALRQAFAEVSRLRLEHHAAQIEAEQSPDNLVDPDHLPPLTRLDLQEALRAIAGAQKQLAHHVPLGL